MLDGNTAALNTHEIRQVQLEKEEKQNREGRILDIITEWEASPDGDAPWLMWMNAEAVLSKVLFYTRAGESALLSSYLNTQIRQAAENKYEFRLLAGHYDQ